MIEAKLADAASRASNAASAVTIPDSDPIVSSLERGPAGPARAEGFR